MRQIVVSFLSAANGTFMKLTCHGYRILALALTAAIFMPGSDALALPNNWTNSASALWRSSTNWSLAVVPYSSSGVDPTQITNAGTKAASSTA
jgi:hypothetical protein